MSNRFRAGALVLVSAMALPGCAAPPDAGAPAVRAPTDFASRRIAGASLLEAETAAARIFRSHFRIDAEASNARRLISRPLELEGPGEPRTLGDHVRLTPVREREIAELRIDPQDEGVLFQVHVSSQRLETSERAAFAHRRSDDRPNTTAIDRAGPASTDQREEWRTVGRNRRTEQRILSEVEAALAPGTRPAVEP